MNKRVTAIVSGGMDSVTMLYDLIAQGKEVYPLSFNYGQRHMRELKAAGATMQKLGIANRWLQMPLVSLGKLGGSALTDQRIEVPKGHYADETMKATVVPNRNMVMLSMAIAHAIALKADEVYYGAHSGDHAIYPDCRPEFLEAMNKVASVCHYTPVKIVAPYLNLTKGDIVKKGLELGVDYSLTYTCYNGLPLACGKCGSCTERLEAFAQNGAKDPISYI